MSAPHCSKKVSVPVSDVLCACVVFAYDDFDKHMSDMIIDASFYLLRRPLYCNMPSIFIFFEWNFYSCLFM